VNPPACSSTSTASCALESGLVLCIRNLTARRDVNKVDQTMEEVREQMEVATEISAAISTPIPTGHDVRRALSDPRCKERIEDAAQIDQEDLEKELEELEQQ
jgi:charged multivesicular body protein 4